MADTSALGIIWCSAVKPEGGCAHGHDVTVGCWAPKFHAPVCVREDRRWDEQRQAVTVAPWPPKRYWWMKEAPRG